MAHVSDIKLIRTDTTLDLSQKAEKGREAPSPDSIINPGAEGFQKLFFAQEEIAIPVGWYMGRAESIWILCQETQCPKAWRKCPSIGVKPKGNEKLPSAHSSKQVDLLSLLVSSAKDPKQKMLAKRAGG
ncbi:hypothetical protein SAY86_021463 [Trapa natans]|uniref:Uncharacterized protein n=1 Tax=Trapa natans TaxID=22666 RepID=A0AAN7MU54_TRANT|nr:hypothetical protein SAY86_021463 [Trapa natans]